MCMPYHQRCFLQKLEYVLLTLKKEKENHSKLHIGLIRCVSWNLKGILDKTIVLGKILLYKRTGVKEEHSCTAQKLCGFESLVFQNYVYSKTHILYFLIYQENKQCWLFWLFWLLHTANIFNVIFTLFTCVPLSTVIPLHMCTVLFTFDHCSKYSGKILTLIYSGLL